jgi:RHS repeat-associated protein
MDTARSTRVHVVLVLIVALATGGGSALADTGTSLGDRAGEGSGQFTGLAGAPEANLFTGALTTNVRIDVPPGRKNMSPQLALQYSSSMGPSPFGYGWDLPIGRIERSTKWGVPRCDAHADDFVLILPSGAVELVAETPGGNVFRPKIEEAYVKAERDTVLNRWTVYDRAGLKYTFGDVDSARVGNSSPLVFMASNPCRFTSIWALTKIEDGNGNIVLYAWSKVFNVLYPATVYYGGNTNAPTIPHLYKVQFTYVTRPAGDQIRNARYGVDALLSQRLLTIQVSSLVLAQQGVIRTYALLYRDNPTGAGPDGYRSLLSRVAVTGQPPVDFVYKPSVSTHLPYTTITKPSGAYGELRVPNSSQELYQTLLDVNGDGYLDLVRADYYPSANKQWAVWIGYRNATTGAFGFSASITPWNVPFAGLPIRNVFVNSEECGSAPDWSCAAQDTFDITGDGIPDYVIAARQGTTLANWEVYQGRYNGTLGRWEFNATVSYWPAAGRQFLRKSYQRDTIQDLVDISGDGRPDLVRSNASQSGGPPYTWSVYLNIANGFESTAKSYTAPVKHISKHSGWGVEHVLADFNGDGLPDILRSGAATVGPLSSDYRCEQSPTIQASCLEVFYNTGQGFWTSPQLIPVPLSDTVQASISTNPPTNTNFQVMQDLVDINGDGLPDWVYRRPQAVGYDSEWRVLLNLGGTLEDVTYVPHALYFGYSEAIPARIWQGGEGVFRSTIDGKSRTEMIDINGDGLLDHVESAGQASNQWKVWLNSATERPNVLGLMTNGLGGSSTVFYAPSTRYDNTGGDFQPDLPFVTWVVQGIRQSDGQCSSQPSNPLSGTNPCLTSGNDVVGTFDYQDGRFDGAAREFRGFRRVIRRTVEGMAGGQPVGNDAVTYFGQADATKGRVLQVDTYAGASDAGSPAKARAEINLWSTSTPGANRTKIWLAENSRQTWDYPAATQSHFVKTVNVSVDTYGNVTQHYTVGTVAAERVDTYTSYAAPVGGAAFPVYDRPWNVRIQDASGPLEEKWFYYDPNASQTPLPLGSVDKGNVGRVQSRLTPTDSNGPNTRNEYDVYGNITRVIDPNGYPNGAGTSTGYDGVFLFPSTVTNAKGHVTTTEMNYLYGQPKKVTDPNGEFTQYSYDAAGRRQCVARPGEQLSDCPIKYEYFLTPASGQLASIKVTERQDAPKPRLSVQQYFDGLGRLRHTDTFRVVAGTATTVRSGRTEYDGGGRVAKAYNPYLASGSPAASDFTTFDYHLNGSAYIDPFGRVWRTTYSDLSATEQRYAGTETTAVDELGTQTKTVVDAFGRTTSATVYNGATSYSTTAFTYDGMGRQKTVGVNGTTLKTISYDSLGRKTQLVDANSGTWKYGYDANGNLRWQDDPKPAQHVQICYDEINRPARRCPVDNLDFSTLYSCSIGCGYANEVRYEYDQAIDPSSKATGRLSKVYDPSGWTEFTDYDARGRVEKVAKGISFLITTTARFEYTYDGNDRPKTVKYPDGEIVSTVYDDSGQPWTLDNGTEVFVTDAQYDLYGRLMFIQHGNGVKDSREYGGASQRHRPTRVNALKNGTTTHLDIWLQTYNLRGQLTYLLDGRDASGDLSNTGQLAYDFMGRLTRFDAPGTMRDLDYAYDARHNITRSGNWYFDYDNPSKPNQTTDIHIGSPTGSGFVIQHNENGSRTYKNGDTYDYDPDGRVKQVTATSNVLFAYDYSGQKTIELDTTAGASTRYYSERLATTNAGQIKFYYMGGLRVASKSNTNTTWQTAALGTVGPIQVASTTVEHPALVLRLDPSHGPWVAATAVFVCVAFLVAPWRRRRAVVGVRVRYGHAAGAVLVFFVAALPWPILLLPRSAEAQTTTLRHYHQDHLGSTQVVTNESGDIAEQVRFEPYGKARYRTGTSPFGPRFEFTGYETQGSGGLEYAGARFYDPSLGSFLTHDPAAQFTNPYTYTGWDPANRVDPTGALAWWVIPLVVAVIASTVTTIQALINGASPLEAFKAGAIAGAIAFVSASILGPVGEVAHAAGGWQWASFLAVSLSSGAYGVAEGFRTGQYFAAAVGAILLAYGAYAAYRANASAGARASEAHTAQGANEKALTEGPEVVGPNPEPGTRFPEWAQRALSEPDQPSGLGRAAARAQVRVATTEELSAEAVNQGVSVDEISAFTRGDTIYVRPNEALRLGPAAHELVHVRDYLHGLGPEYSLEVDRLASQGLSGRSLWMNNTFERVAIGAEIRTLDRHFFFGP